MIKVNLGILNLLDWLVGGVGGERGDFGGHLGHKLIDSGLALPLIDLLLNLGLVLSVREGGAGRSNGADLWSSRTYFYCCRQSSGSGASRDSLTADGDILDRRGKTCRLCSGRTGWRDRLEHILKTFLLLITGGAGNGGHLIAGDGGVIWQLLGLRHSALPFIVMVPCQGLGT